jgi:hypothetical protein
MILTSVELRLGKPAKRLHRRSSMNEGVKAVPP